MLIIFREFCGTIITESRETSPQGKLPFGLDNIDLKKYRRSILMSKSKVNVPEAKAALDKFKMEAANEVGVTLKQGDNGDLTSRQAGSIGGQMVNIMNPVRTMIFERHNRISQGHKITVKYAFSLTV